MSRHENFDIAQATRHEPIYTFEFRESHASGSQESHNADRIRYEFLETLAQALKLADVAHRHVQKELTMTIIDLFGAEAKGMDVVSPEFVRALLTRAENRGGDTSMSQSSVEAFDIMTQQIGDLLKRADQMKASAFHEGIEGKLHDFNLTLSGPEPSPISLSHEGAAFFSSVEHRRYYTNARMMTVADTLKAKYEL